jgi:ribosomal protein S18 acetylase RimI-like enzyme
MKDEFHNSKLENKILCFLKAVDKQFPVPLSEKQDLKAFAQKLCSNATLCYTIEDHEIVSLVAGYTENTVNNMGYISIVATLPKAQKRGLSKELLRDFIAIAREKCLDVVHLYTTQENIAALKLYKNLGFIEWKLKTEIRPHDVHLICWLDGRKVEEKL